MEPVFYFFPAGAPHLGHLSDDSLNPGLGGISAPQAWHIPAPDDFC